MFVLADGPGLHKPVSTNAASPPDATEQGLHKPVSTNAAALPPLRGGARRRRPYFDRHRRFDAYLTPQETDRIDHIMRQRGVGFAGFVRLALEEFERRRPSEAGQYVRCIVPDYFVRLAVPLFLREATTLQEAWRRMDRKTADGMQRAANVRAESVLHYDGAAWASDVLKRYDRLAEGLPDGQSLDPTNPHTQDRVALHPTTVEEE